MELFAMLTEWCLLAQRQSVFDGALRGAIIGGVVGGIVGIGIWAIKKFQKGSAGKSSGDEPPTGG